MTKVTKCSKYNANCNCIECTIKLSIHPSGAMLWCWSFLGACQCNEEIEIVLRSFANNLHEPLRQKSFAPPSLEGAIEGPQPIEIQSTCALQEARHARWKQWQHMAETLMRQSSSRLCKRIRLLRWDCGCESPWIFVRMILLLTPPSHPLF